MTLDPRQDRTALRLKLYANGFTPLPNHMKACFLPEWSTVKVTPELIQSREWARSRAWADTGLRCGDIIAIDWDVNDGDLLNELLDQVVQEQIIPESPFVRVGRPPREMWIYRTSDKIGKRTTGAFKRPDAPDDYEGEKVEILGAGNQFAAYGQRDENTAYSWPVESLLDAQYMDLPAITFDQVEALKLFAIGFFESNGLERKSAMAGTDGGYNHVYDLTPDMVFDVKDMGAMTVAEISDYLHTAADDVLRCGAGPFRPSSGRNDSCMVSLVQGAVCISDHGEYAAHFLAELDDNKALARLGALLAPRIEAAEAAAQAAPMAYAPDEVFERIDPYDKLDDNLVRALKRYAFVESDGVVYDLGSKDVPWFTTRSFKDSLAGCYTTKVGQKGGEQIVLLFDLWMMHKDRIVVNKVAMRPDHPEPIFEEDGIRILNTYRPPRHNQVGGSADIGLEMLDNLLPVPAERNYLKQWLRHKIENPHVPSTGIVMVAHDTYGTGRGSFFSLLGDVFGQKYVTNIDFDTLTGRNSQAQYTEWREDNVLITVDEAQENSGKWQTRTNAFEAIKKVVDPSTKSFMATRKGIKNSSATSYISIIVATNHLDAFVIPADDRRLAVLENGQPMPPEYWVRFHAWRANPANVAAFVAAIRQVDISSFQPYAAPLMTRAKADMIDAGQSDLDRAIKDIMRYLTGAIVVKEQVILKLEDYLGTHAVEFPEGWDKVAVSAWNKATKKILGEDRIMIDGKQRVMRAIGTITQDMLASPEALRAELDKNGPISRTLKTGGSVVSFQQRR